MAPIINIITLVFGILGTLVVGKGGVDIVAGGVNLMLGIILFQSGLNRLEILASAAVPALFLSGKVAENADADQDADDGDDNHQFDQGEGFSS